MEKNSNFLNTAGRTKTISEVQEKNVVKESSKSW